MAMSPLFKFVLRDKREEESTHHRKFLTAQVSAPHIRQGVGQSTGHTASDMLSEDQEVKCHGALEGFAMQSTRWDLVDLAVRAAGPPGEPGARRVYPRSRNGGRERDPHRRVDGVLPRARHPESSPQASHAYYDVSDGLRLRPLIEQAKGGGCKSCIC
jgi:hypothetical protein